MENLKKFTYFFIIFFHAKNLHGIDFEKTKSILKISLANYSSYYIIREFGKPLIEATIDSIKEKDAPQVFSLLTFFAPCAIGNYYLYKDFITEEEKKTKPIKELTLDRQSYKKSLKALFTNKNGYSCIAKSMMAAYSTFWAYNTSKGYLDELNQRNPEGKIYQEIDQEDIKKIVATILPAIYGIYKLTLSSKDSFEKACEQTE